MTRTIDKLPTFTVVDALLKNLPVSGDCRKYFISRLSLNCVLKIAIMIGNIRQDRVLNLSEGRFWFEGFFLRLFTCSKQLNKMVWLNIFSTDVCVSL